MSCLLAVKQKGVILMKRRLCAIAILVCCALGFTITACSNSNNADPGAPNPNGKGQLPGDQKRPAPSGDIEKTN